MSSFVSRKMFYAIIGTSCLLLFLADCTRRPTEPGTWSVGNNQPAKLADYKGKVVVLDFYATWCEPCRAETPLLVQLQKDYGASGLQVVGINVGGDDDRPQVPIFAEDFEVEYPLGFPDDNLVHKYLTDIQDIPQAFVFDRNGDLMKRFVGYSPASGAELERIVKAALDGPVAKHNQ